MMQMEDSAGDEKVEPVEEKQSIPFKRGHIVFARLKGFPPWPSRVEEIIEGKNGQSSSRQYSVLFFETHDTAKLKERDLKDFLSERETFISKYHKSKKLMSAIEEADRYINIPFVKTEVAKSEDEQSEDEKSEDEQNEDEQNEDEKSEDEKSEDEQHEDEESEEEEEVHDYTADEWWVPFGSLFGENLESYEDLVETVLTSEGQRHLQRMKKMHEQPVFHSEYNPHPQRGEKRRLDFFEGVRPKVSNLLENVMFYVDLVRNSCDKKELQQELRKICSTISETVIEADIKDWTDKDTMQLLEMTVKCKRKKRHDFLETVGKDLEGGLGGKEFDLSNYE
ncbi:dynein heavy chain-like protein 2 [Neocloeon triangulifer]|uniref:dynein heavy chain-like protein 2 n=1 Tax=Neocloeon triangulifer TaxID=2078957 RepID=UPI00286F9FAB|nr:dynein heavy chain-like protein 2 [Neocloeon triangulifer]